MTSPPGWYRDSFARFEHRFWDGAMWTQHVGSQGRRSIDPPVSGPTLGGAPLTQPAGELQVSGPVMQSSPASGPWSLLDLDLLVIKQQARMRNRADYRLHDQHGHVMGEVREVKGSLLKKLVVGGGTKGPSRKYVLEVVDNRGSVILRLRRPSAILRSSIVVSDPRGFEIGRVAQKSLGLIGGVKFELTAAGRSIGTMLGEDSSSWAFAIRDASGQDVAHVTKDWAGLAREWFTTADHYTLRTTSGLPDPLRSVALAAAIGVDLAFKQQGRGKGPRSARRRRT